MDHTTTQTHEKRRAREILSLHIPRNNPGRTTRHRRGGLQSIARVTANSNKLTLNTNFNDDNSGKVRRIDHVNHESENDAPDFVIPGEDEFHLTYDSVRKSSNNSTNKSPISLVAAFCNASSPTTKGAEFPDKHFDENPSPKQPTSPGNFGKLFGNIERPYATDQRSRNKEFASNASTTTDSLHGDAPKGKSRDFESNTVEPALARTNQETASVATAYNKINDGENNSIDNKSRVKLDSRDGLLLENSNKLRRTTRDTVKSNERNHSNTKPTKLQDPPFSRLKLKPVAQPQQTKKRSQYLPMYIQPVKDDPPTKFSTYRGYNDYVVNRNINNDIMYSHTSSTDSLLSKSSISSQRKISTDMNKYDSSSSSDTSTDDESVEYAKSYTKPSEKSARLPSFEYKTTTCKQDFSPGSSDNSQPATTNRRRRRARNRRISNNQRRNPIIAEQTSQSSRFDAVFHDNIFMPDKYATVPDNFVANGITNEASVEDKIGIKSQEKSLKTGESKDRTSSNEDNDSDKKQVIGKQGGQSKVGEALTPPVYGVFKTDAGDHNSAGDQLNNINSQPATSTRVTSSKNRSNHASGLTKDSFQDYRNPVELKKHVEDIRSIFNSQTGISGDLGQSYLPKTKISEEAESTRQPPRANKNPQRIHDTYENVVESKPLIKARKVSEHFWPKDEATEKLLKHPEPTKQSRSLSNSDKMQETIDQLKGLADDSSLTIPENKFSVSDITTVSTLAQTKSVTQSRSTNDLTYTSAGQSVKRPAILNISKVQMVRIPTLDVSPSMSQSVSEENLLSEQKNVRKRTANKNQSFMKTNKYPMDIDEIAKTLPNLRGEKQKHSPLHNPTILQMKELTASLRKFKLAGPPNQLTSDPPTLQKAVLNSDPLLHVDKCGAIIVNDDGLKRSKTGESETSLDIDEGIGTEPVLSPINHEENVSKFTAHLNSEKGRKASRRRRKGSSTGNSDIAGSNIDSQRCKSDPIADRSKKPEGDNTVLDSNLLGVLQAPKQDMPSSNLSSMSILSEDISDIGAADYKYYEDLDDMDDKQSDQAEITRRNVKKKSLSDPNPKGVISGGFNGDGDVIDEAAVCSASSEPNIAEQSDQLGDLEQFRKYRSSKALSDTKESIQNKNDLHKLNQTQDTMSPRGIRKSVSLKARRRAQKDAVKMPSKSYSHENILLKKDSDESGILENETNKFNEIYESMRLEMNHDEPHIVDQPRNIHSRSSSEPVPMSDEAIALAKYGQQNSNNTNRSRRMAIIHGSPFENHTPGLISNEIANSANDISLRRLSSKSPDMMTGKNMDRGFATLPRASKPMYGDGKRPDMRLLVLNNLLESEESYVNALQVLYEEYYKPLKKPENHVICEPRLVDEMFFQIPQILQHHESFSDNLRHAVHTWHVEEIKLGELFMNSFNRDMLLESYSAYIRNFLNAREAMRIAIQQKAGFKAFIEQCQRENKEKQGLSDLMIKPVQRIPRYELILKDLIKHTPADHPDRDSLLNAQQEIHTLAEQMNHGEKEAEVAEKHARLLQEIESFIDNCVDLCVPKRRFLRQDIAVELKNGTKKDRSIWLFNDLIMCTTVKKGRTGVTRRSSMSLWTMGQERVSIDFNNKYKFMWKFPLEDIELVTGGIPSRVVVDKQVQDLQADIDILQKIHKLTNELSVNHQIVDDCLKDLITTTNRQLADKQQITFHSSGTVRVELAIATAGEIKHITFEFTTEEFRNQFETMFTKSKSCLTQQNNLWEPIFLKAIPIAKTRSGMQFSCATPNIDTSSNLRVVWVCNSDGFVGQVCLLDLEKGIPTQTNSISVCTSKICCIAEIPPPDRKLVPTHEFMKEISMAPILSHNRSSSVTSNNPAKNIIAWDDDTDEDDEDNTSEVSTSCSSYRSHPDSPYNTNNSNAGGNDAYLRNTISDTRGLQDGSAWKKSSNGSTLHGSLDDLLRDQDQEDTTQFVSGKGSMWLGTEDGKIHIYPSSNSVRGSQNCIRAIHTASVQCIVYYENQVFVALNSGDLVCYLRNINGDWDFDNKTVLPLGSAQHAINKMVIVDVERKELWCACQNQIIIVDTDTKTIVKSFLVSDESKRQVNSMVCCGYGVWIALDKRPQIKLYHAITQNIITEFDVGAPVNKMLASSDAIIRQHKSACLRITALLVCKELLWAGTSAGVVLTLKLPKVQENTTSLSLPIMPLGLTYGHTGHVRFLTAVDVPDEQQKGVRRSSSFNKRRSSIGSNAGGRTLVISGGDGFEDFRMNSTAESAGKEDSTNHLLIWRV